MSLLSKHDPTSSPEVGLLLVGHGTRDPEGLAGFRALADMVHQRFGETPVAACFLEMATPTIQTGIEQLLDQGARKVVVAPLLLFAAGHAKRDIPDAVAAGLDRYCETRGDASDKAISMRKVITTAQLPPLACHEKLLMLSELRYQAATELSASTGEMERSSPTGRLLSKPHLTHGEVPAAKPTLVLVGRGSTDSEAIAEMHRFASFRAAQHPDIRVEVAFYALAEPKLPEVLERVVNSESEEVVLQPHLLFAGEVLSGIRDCGKKFAASVSHRQRWRMAGPLGPDPLLAEAIVDLFHGEQGI